MNDVQRGRAFYPIFVDRGDAIQTPNGGSLP